MKQKRKDRNGMETKGKERHDMEWDGMGRIPCKGSGWSLIFFHPIYYHTVVAGVGNSFGSIAGPPVRTQMGEDSEFNLFLFVQVFCLRDLLA